MADSRKSTCSAHISPIWFMKANRLNVWPWNQTHTYKLLFREHWTVFTFSTMFSKWMIFKCLIELQIRSNLNGAAYTISVEFPKTFKFAQFPNNTWNFSIDWYLNGSVDSINLIVCLLLQVMAKFKFFFGCFERSYSEEHRPRLRHSFGCSNYCRLSKTGKKCQVLAIFMSMVCVWTKNWPSG